MVLIRALTNLGSVSIRIGDYDKSLEYYQRCLTMAGTLKDSVSMAGIFNNLGGLYSYLSNYDSAIQYFKKSYNLYSSWKDTSGIIPSLLNIGSMERELMHYTSARDKDKQAWEISKIYNAHNYKLQVLEGLAQDYLQMEDYANAEKYLKRALAMNQDEKNIYLSSSLKNSLVEVFIKSGRPDSAQAYMKSGLIEAQFIDNKELLMMYYKSAAELSVLKGNYREAYQNFTEFHNYYDSLNSQSTRSRITDLEMKYQNDKKEDAIRNLQVNHEILELKIRKANLEKFLLILVILFGLIAVLTVSIMYWNARRAKILVQKKNDELADAIDIKNQLFSIIAHDLKNPLNAIVGFSSLLSGSSSTNNEKVVKYAERIRESGLQGFEMIEKLLEWSRLNMDDIHLTFATNDMFSVSEKACLSIRNYADMKGIRIVNDIVPDTLAFFDKYSIESVLRNLISNAVKYSSEGNSVTVTAEKKDDHLIIGVEDQGTGIPVEIQDKILNSKMIVSQPGTQNEKGTGLGITLSKEFVRRNFGELWFDSVPSEGTHFFFSLLLQPPASS